LWLSQPVNVGWQAGPRAPNFEPYPFSDALTYDQFAQSVLIGNGLFGDAIPARPLYVIFLAALHALAGQDYVHVIALQSLVLALFPVTLYFLGNEISGRPLGVMLAVLAATRDAMTNLAADFAGNFSFSKFYLAELPTALLLSVFALLIIRGAKRPSARNLNFMLAGGVLGLATLIRTQSLFLLPPALLIAYLSNRVNWKAWFGAVAVLAVTLALTIIPWLWRNWHITGGIVMDDPYSQMSIRAMWYHGQEDIVDRLPNENDKDYSARLMSIALAGIRENPGPVARLILSHFLNSEVGNLLVFPVRDGLDSPGELLQPTRAFWDEVELDFRPAQSALLAMYLLLFSLGVATAWHSKGWIGLMPLAINTSYNLSTAAFMSSGMRFLLPADWGFYFYYALGLLALTRLLFMGLEATSQQLHNRETNPDVAAAPPSRAWRPIVAGCMIFFLLGSSIPLSEKLVPQRYPPVSRAVLAQSLIDATPQAARSELDLLLNEPGVVILRGRALYPRYYAAGEGEPGTTKLGYGEMPQARLVFSLIGDRNSLVIFDIEEPPAFFPNASDVLLIARPGAAHLQALAILVESDGRSVLYLTSPK
jgi:hypothetical protein